MVETEAIDDSVEDTMDDDITDVTPDDTLGNVEYFNSSLVEDSYILVNDAGNNRAYLMNKNAELIHEWPLSNNIGNDARLLPDGRRLLAILEADTFD